MGGWSGRTHSSLSLSLASPFCSAYNRSWEGDHSLYTGAFLKRHSSLWRLSDRGREQARIAGEWLRKEIDHLRILDQLQPDQSPIYRYYVSEYIRAMETAALLDIKDAKWFVEVQLRERDWGTFDIMVRNSSTHPQHIHTITRKKTTRYRRMHVSFISPHH